jgi:hypothetical protein
MTRPRNSFTRMTGARQKTIARQIVRQIITLCSSWAAPHPQVLVASVPKSSLSSQRRIRWTRWGSLMRWTVLTFHRLWNLVRRTIRPLPLEAKSLPLPNKGPYHLNQAIKHLEEARPFVLTTMSKRTGTLERKNTTRKRPWMRTMRKACMDQVNSLGNLLARLSQDTNSSRSPLHLGKCSKWTCRSL